MNLSVNRLITIPISHYCEKARWALDWAGIPYSEERHLQGFHYWPIYRAGKTDSVPVLITPNKVLGDSTLILQWCNNRLSEDRKLYPGDLNLKQQIEQFEDEMDEGLGVAGRLWMYTYMFDHLSLILKYSKDHGVPGYEIRLMPFIFPVMKGRIKRVLGLTPRSRLESRLLVDEVFHKVGQMLADGRAFLFGPHFTAADLTFASLAAAVLIPENYGVQLPSLEELPEEMKEQVEKWRKHPAGRFALEIFRKYRNAD